jgi:hypothetical protein
MGNEAVMVCRSCPVLTTERFSDRRRTHNPRMGLMLCLGVGGGKRQGDQSNADAASVFTRP